MMREDSRTVTCAGSLFALALMTAAPVQAQDIARGEEVFKRCLSCHQIGEGAKNDVGPQLNGIAGSPAASRSGFPYSRALNEARTEGLVWSDENLDRYLANPRKFLSGGRMAFAGIAADSDRAAIIAYLKQFPR